MNYQIIEKNLSDLRKGVEIANKVMDFIRSVKGDYYFIGPYHKNKKKLPFRILGGSTFGEYPVDVITVEYKGWERSEVRTGYKIESIKGMIESGFIKPYPMFENGKLNKPL
jgi:hypothetical protein